MSESAATTGTNTPAPPAEPATGGVTAAAQSTADQLTGIDKQVQAALAVSVDGSLLPSLATDLASLHAQLAQWTSPIRPNVTAALKQGFAVDESVLAIWPVNSTDLGAMLAFADVLGKRVTTSAAAVGQVDAAVAPLRTGLDACLGSLQNDSQALSAKLAADQDSMSALEDQIEDDDEEIEEFHEDPMRFLLQSGVDISSVMTEATQLLVSEKSAQASLDLLQQTSDAITQLTTAGGALTTLSAMINGLGTSLINLQTAADQISNKLSGIVTKPLLAILAAQLEAMVTDLRAADAIITELSAGT